MTWNCLGCSLVICKLILVSQNEWSSEIIYPDWNNSVMTMINHSKQILYRLNWRWQTWPELTLNDLRYRGSQGSQDRGSQDRVSQDRGSQDRGFQDRGSQDQKIHYKIQVILARMTHQCHHVINIVSWQLKFKNSDPIKMDTLTSPWCHDLWTPRHRRHPYDVVVVRIVLEMQEWLCGCHEWLTLKYIW